MGTAKRQNEQKQQKKWKKSPDERRIELHNQLGQTLDTVTPKLLEDIYESVTPIVQLTFRQKYDGSWLVIAKRDTSRGYEVLFSGGEDFLECFIRLDQKLKKGGWKEDTPYNPPA